MPTPRLCHAVSSRVFAFAAGLALTSFAATALADVYDPPPAYYAAATGTGATLKSQLKTIISTNVQVRSYANAIEVLKLTEADPNNSSRIILVYTGVSVPNTWDAGATWNREHTWPDSRGLGGSGPDYTDLHQLRPCNPSVNSSRKNDPFGPQSSSYWDPDHLALSTPYRYRGEMARIMFYMDTRYDGSQSSTVDLSLVNGFPSGNQMGDLSYLLEWHYSSPVTERERRRNHIVYSSAANPSYFQGNRNPFTDHPEYVWAIWGTQPNNSTIYVGSTPAPNGSSSVSVDLGTVIVGAALPAQNVTVTKSGSTPTTFNITASGAAASADAYPGRAFTYHAQSLVMSVGLSGAGLPGAYSGSLTIDNSDLTSAAAGQGAADGDDTVNVSGTVLAHANASFEPAADVNTLVIDLGRVRAGSGLHAQPFSIYNLQSAPGFTAALDIDSVTGAGDTAVAATDLLAVSGIGSAVPGAAWIDSAAAVGMYEATYTIAVSDANAPGAVNGTSLALTVTGEIACASDFDLDGFVSGDDFDAFVAAFQFGEPGADMNGDEFVTGEDFDAYVEAFVNGC